MLNEPQAKLEIQADETDLFLQAAKSAEDIFFIVNEDRSVRFTNGKGASGAAPSTCAPSVGVVCRDICKILHKSIESVFETGRALSAECRLGEPGREIWLHNLLTPISDGSGKVSSILGIARDISELKLSQELIANSRSEWVQAVDTMPHLLAMVDINYQIKKANKALANLLGLELEELLGRTCHEVLGVHAQESCPLKRANSPGCGAGNFQSDISGQAFLTTTSPLSDAAGATTGCLFVAVGLNAHPDGEKNKKRIVEQMKTLFGQAEYVVTIQDKSGRYLSMKALPGNIQFPEGIVGKTPFDFFETTSASRISDGTTKAIRTGRELTVSSELTLGGETFHLLDHISPVSDETGKISLVVSISKKIEWANKTATPIPNDAPGLSARELEVLQLIGSGLTTSQIAEKLYISRKTVETHRSRIMQKLGLHKSAALVHYAVKTGMF